MQVAMQITGFELTAAGPSLRRSWLVPVGSIIALHLALALFLPGRAWISCIGIGGAYAVAALLSLRMAYQESGILRLKWAMFATAFTLRAGRDVATLYGVYVLHFTPTHAWIHSALLLLSAVPLLFVVSTDDEEGEPSAFALLDGLQLLLIAGLILYDLFPGAYLSGGQEWSAVSIDGYTRLRNVEFPLLLILAAARTYAATAPRTRFFYASMLALLLPIPILNWFTDWVLQHGVQPGSPIFVLNDIPALAFVFVWTSGISLSPASPTHIPRARVASIIRLVSPVFFALAALLLSLQAIPSPMHLGVWTACTTVAIHGIRSAFLQLRQQHTQDRLIMAQTELLSISRKDPLTELYNRRWFDETHRIEWLRAQRVGQSLSLLIVDIDHFKDFNDSAGHKAGDQCLVAVATALRKQLLRETESISRYGGEEFAVILPGTDRAGAALVAERIRQAVATLGYDYPGNSAKLVTVSIGVASIIPAHTDTVSDDLFMLADAALYRAKQLGRNRVEVAN